MCAFEFVKSDDVLVVVKNKGPLQPLDAKREMNKGDSIVIGACLSELVARGLVKVTSVKKGGSPFYYAPGQEDKLAELSKYLNEKDLRAYELLKKEKILRDIKQDPLVRVCLRAIKDYSRSFDVVVNGQSEIFWRYYTVSEDEAGEIVRKMFKPKQPPRPETVVQKPVEQAETKAAPIKEDSKTVLAEVHKKAPVKKEKEEKQIQLPVTKPISSISSNNDDFYRRLMKFFEEKSIVVKEGSMVKKNSEYDFVVNMSTPVGNADYYCKARNKKKCNDGDLSTAYLQGQMRRLPVIFITTGEVVKKTKEKINTDFKGMIIREI